MPSLTTVPTEIRRQILLDVLLCPSPPPKSPSESQSRSRGKNLKHYGIWFLDNEPTKLANTALPLFLINRLINIEINDILFSKSCNRIKNMTLDVMWVKSAGIWPTWTNVPILTQNIHTLTTTFRIFNPPDDLDHKFDKSLEFYIGNGGRGGVFTPYHLLTGFLLKGPLRHHEAESYGNGTPLFTVRNLILDIEIPPSDEDHSIVGPMPKDRLNRRFNKSKTGEFFPFAPENWPQKWQRPLNGVIDPRTIPAEKLGLFLANELNDLLRLNYYTMNYGMILYEGILETLEIRVGGETRAKFIMEDMLEMERNDWGMTEKYIEERKVKYAEWKQWVKERRRQCMKDAPAENGDRPHAWII